jgi:small subunit ribosomal protein S7
MGFKKWTASVDQLKPDMRYGKPVVSKFINCMMKQGKKSVATRIFYDAMEIVKQKTAGQPTEIEVFETALNNVKPNVEVRSRRVGGANYQVPISVNKKRQQSLAFRWIIDAARAQKGKPMCQRLAGEILDAFNKQGAAVTMRDNTHKMADANKAFAHFAW